jgi:hypothetical protein
MKRGKSCGVDGMARPGRVASIEVVMFHNYNSTAPNACSGDDFGAPRKSAEVGS